MFDYPEALECIPCPLEKTVAIIGNKWSLLILKELHFTESEDKVVRFNELLRSLKPISSKTLSSKLKELVKFEVVRKEVIPTTPIQVRYSLTEKGRDLEMILTPMAQWGLKWHNK